MQVHVTHLRMWITFEPRMARRKLRIDPDFDFILAGMSTPLQDYRLAWWVNKALHIQLSRAADLVVTDQESRLQTSFSRFDFQEDLTRSFFHLLQNKQGSVLLLPEVREMDYLLLIKGEYYRSRHAGIAKKLRTIEQMLAVVIINTENLKSKNNLIIDTPNTNI